ncbi:hypothetical protein [Pseudomonas sp. URMO17WK12:I4]|uniref:hypothetical protein n=1 Tax=Pseudomonas sp. URMO17WK12:I4 TaxID=1283292 RepID=UPI0012DDEFDF|nr:hypothetical protein [Pseudomonas sp. URMO17WK12:I4]
MDVFIALLVFSAVVGIFVVLVRRSNAQARTLDNPQAYQKPELLTRAQRKELNLPRPPAATVPIADSLPKPKPAVTRAIRTGWSIGVVAFTYEDSVGNITDRIVTVHSVSSMYIKGECHDQHEERTFRIDRILGELTDCETGEILLPKFWVTSRKR